MSKEMVEVKCFNCKKLLCKALSDSSGIIEIKCPRCKETHVYKLETPEVQD